MPMAATSLSAGPCRKSAQAQDEGTGGQHGRAGQVWNVLDTCYDGPEKYIVEALEPIIKFRKYKVF